MAKKDKKNKRKRRDAGTHRPEDAAQQKADAG